MTQPKAIFLAEVLEAELRSAAHHDAAAAELRRLQIQNAELTENLERKSSAIQRIWKERDELRKQRSALLEALKLAKSIIGHPDDAHSQMIDAAIKAVEEGK